MIEVSFALLNGESLYLVAGSLYLCADVVGAVLHLLLDLLSLGTQLIVGELVDVGVGLLDDFYDRLYLSHVAGCLVSKYLG